MHRITAWALRMYAHRTTVAPIGNTRPGCVRGEQFREMHKAMLGKKMSECEQYRQKVPAEDLQSTPLVPHGHHIGNQYDT